METYVYTDVSCVILCMLCVSCVLMYKRMYVSIHNATVESIINIILGDVCIKQRIHDHSMLRIPFTISISLIHVCIYTF